MSVGKLLALHFKRTGSAYLVLILSLAFTLILFVGLRRQVDLRERNRFMEAVRASSRSMEFHLLYHLELLKSVRGLFLADADRSVTHFEWKQFLNTFNLKESHPGVLDIGFAPRVSAAAWEEQEQAIMAGGAPLDRSHGTRAGADRFPVVYLMDVTTGDQRDTDWDAAAEPMRRAAMERARDEGKAISTGKTGLFVHGSTNQIDGFLVYLPVYRNGATPATVEERRESLQGFVFGSYLPRKLWAGILDPDNPIIDIELFQGEVSEGNLLYDDNGVYHGAENPQRWDTTEKHALGQRWKVYFSTTDAFELDSKRRLSVGLLGGGIVTSFLLFGIAWIQVNARTAGEKLAVRLQKSREVLEETNQRLQQDIAERRKAEAALRESEERLAGIVETMTDGIVILDLEGRITFVNPAAAELYRLSREEMLGLRWESWAVRRSTLEGRPFPEDELPASRVLRERRSIHGVEYALEIQPGVVRTISANAALLHDIEEMGAALVISVRDVTTGKQAEGVMMQRQGRLKLFNSILAGMATNLSVLEIIARTVKQLHEYFPKLRAGYSVIDESGRLTVLTSCEPESGLPHLSGRAVDLRQAPAYLESLRRREPVIVDDVEKDERLRPLLAVLLEHGNRAVLDLPLRHSETEVGLLCFDAPEPHHWTEDEIIILQEIAEYLGIAIKDGLAQEQRRTAEAALAAEKERLAVTLRSIGDGVITTDTEGKITLVNQEAERLTGRTSAEMLGRELAGIFRVFHEKTREPAGNVVARVLATGLTTEERSPTILLASNGAERIVSYRAAPMLNAAGELIGVVLVFRDITERHKLESEVLKASKIESIGLLAGGIAHDFNNILTGVLGNVSVAKQFTVENVDAQYRLEQAEKACLRAKDLTHQLLTFAKGGAPIRKTASIVEVIDESADFALRGANIRCEKVYPGNLWPVELDEGQINQVIHNLVINAIEAMPEGGVLRISVENLRIEAGPLPLKPGAYVCISVQDSGTGISPEHRSKIFDPYFSTKQRGSGLGLSMSYSIVKKHDGHIEVISQLGQGSTFRIYLPASSETVVAKPEPPAAPQTGNGRILVMDDEPLILDLTKAVLERLGYTVATACNGNEAVEAYRVALAEGRPFAAVIMDLTVPGGLGGKEAVKQVLAIDPEACVIVSSGYSTDPVMANFREFGFKGVAAKPYRPAELAEAVREAIGKS